MPLKKSKEIKEIDWQLVRQHLSRFSDGSYEITPEQDKAILDDRAYRLAQPVNSSEAARVDVLEVVTFSLGHEQYGIETNYVKSTNRLSQLAYIPGGPKILMGLINLRGMSLAVFDIGELIGLKARDISEFSRIIVLGESQAELGILVDQVHEVVNVGRDELMPLYGSIAENAQEYFIGVTRDALILLSGQVLLTHKALFVDEG